MDTEQETAIINYASVTSDPSEEQNPAQVLIHLTQVERQTLSLTKKGKKKTALLTWAKNMVPINLSIYILKSSLN